MTLPAVPLPRDKVDVGGEQVEVRALSRSEVSRLARFAGDNDAAETFVLACGTDLTEEEAQTWRDSVHTDTAGPVIDRICELSGLGEGAQKSG